MDKLEKIKNLIREQLFFILCTQGDNKPYGSLMAYAFKNDLKNIFFSTSKNTRKYKLLSKCKNAAAVIDNRSSKQDEFKKIDVLTITGQVKKVLESEKDYDIGINLLKNRHPYLSDFLGSENNILFSLKPAEFFYVTHFDEIFKWKPGRS